MLSTRHALGRTALLALFAALFFGVSTEKVQAQNINAFIQAVEAAIDKGDFTGLRSLVDKGRDLSVRTALTFERNIVNASASDDEEAIEKNRNYMNQLAVTYKLAHDDPFLSDREKWFKKLSKEQLVQRGLAQKGLNEGFAAKEKATATGNAEQWNEAIKAFDMMMRTALEYGDSFLAVSGSEQCAVAYKALSKDFEEGYYWLKTEKIAEEANLGRARDNAKAELASMKNYGKIKRPDLIDLSLSISEAKKAWEVAYKKSLVVEAPEGAEGESLAPPKPAAEIVFVDDKKFRTVKFDPAKTPVPFYPLRGPESPTASPFYWVSAKDRIAAFERGLKDFQYFPFGEKATVDYDGKLYVDYDGPEGKGKRKQIKLKAKKPVNVNFTAYYDDGGKRKLSLELIDTAFETDVFGIRYKGDPKGRAQFLFRSKSAIQGKIRGHDVTLVDANSSTRFSDYGEDAVIIGKGKSARVDPLGRYIFLPQEDGLYPYEIKFPQKDGNLIRTRPFSGELAPLRVEWKGAGKVKPTFLVAKGEGEFTDFYVDLMKATDELIWIPATTLRVAYGWIEVGRGKKAKTILIGPGRPKGFKVETGKINTWQLGGAGEKGFWLDAKIQRPVDDSRAVEVDGPSVRVYGNGGEVYHNFLVHRPTPDVEIRKEDPNGSVVGRGTMKLPAGNDFPANEMYFPADFRIDRAPRGALVGRLKEKHPIFGEMVSEWLKVE